MIIFAAIRNVDGEEIPSKLSVGPSETSVKDYCDSVKRRTPKWDAKYPVVRIAKFTCKEV